MPRHEQTCLLGYRPSPNKPHDVDHDHYDIYMYYVVLCNICKNVGNEFIETTNKSFKISVNDVKTNAITLNSKEC